MPCPLPAIVVAVIGLSCMGGVKAYAEEGDKPEKQPDAASVSEQTRKSFIRDVCRRIEVAARMWTLPPAFFARLIWKESRFNPNAVSPVGASGIAQFMPGTARLRNLEDPFDLRLALPASAHYLSDLRNRFGNLGLAAAAYNAGPGRVQGWLGGGSRLPYETWDFVSSITGHSPTDWNSDPAPKTDYTLDKKLTFLQACMNFPIRAFKPQLEYAKAPWQPWGVHLTADWSPSKALSFYARLQQKYPDLLTDREPMVMRVINPSFGRAPRYEIRVGHDERADANSFCSRLKKQGGKCLVIKSKPQ